MHVPYFLYFLLLSFFTVSIASDQKQEILHSKPTVDPNSIMGQFLKNKNLNVGKDVKIIISSDQKSDQEQQAPRTNNLYTFIDENHIDTGKMTVRPENHFTDNNIQQDPPTYPPQNQDNNSEIPVTNANEQKEQLPTENSAQDEAIKELKEDLTAEIDGITKKTEEVINSAEKVTSSVKENIGSYISQEQFISYVKQHYPYIIVSGTVFTIGVLCTVIKWSTASLRPLKKKKRKKRPLAPQESAKTGEATDDDLSENDSLI